MSALKAILAGLGLPGKQRTFRHAIISNALPKGAPAAVVREWVGHADQQVIDLYTRRHNDAPQAAMQRWPMQTDNCTRRRRAVNARTRVRHKLSTRNGRSTV